MAIFFWLLPDISISAPAIKQMRHGAIQLCKSAPIQIDTPIKAKRESWI